MRFFSILSRNLYPKTSKLLARAFYYPSEGYSSIPAPDQLGMVGPVVKAMDHSVSARASVSVWIRSSGRTEWY